MTQDTFDIHAARRLADEISENLTALPKDSSKHAELRAEVEELKAMLKEAEAHNAAVEGKMRSVHARFDRAASELQADGIRVGAFLTQIGRMLGLD